MASSLLGRFRRRMSYANVASTLALLLAMSGGAYALTIPDDSVGTRHLKNGAVTTPKLHADAVTTGKVDDGTLRATDFARGELLTWRGTWSASASYVLRDVVFDDGSSYVAVQPSTGSEPPSANWKVLAAQGPAGPSGSGPEIDYQVINHTGLDSVGTQVMNFRGFQVRAYCSHNPSTFQSNMYIRVSSTSANARAEYVSVIGDHADATGAATVRQRGTVLTTTPTEVAALTDFVSGSPPPTRAFLQLFLHSPGQVVVANLTAWFTERHAPEDESCFVKGAAQRGL